MLTIHQIAQFGEFKIYDGKGMAIVHNSNLDFEEGHTHVYNVGYAKHLISIAREKMIPKYKDLRFLESLRRITENQEVRQEIADLIKVKKSKDKQDYVNVQKGVR